MSNDGKGILHFLGIGFTVVTTLVSILTQCQPKEDKHAARNTMLLQTPPKKPILRPMFWAELLDPDWNDSMPFDFAAVAAAGMRYITVEEYSLSPGEDTLKQALEWGEEKGERTRLTQYTLEMNRPVLKHLRVKEFRGTKVKPPKTVVWTGFYEFAYSPEGEMTGLDIRENGDGKDLNESATWRPWSADRRTLDFKHSADWRFIKDGEAELALTEQNGAWQLTAFGFDSLMRPEKLKSSCEKMLRSLQNEGYESKRIETIDVVQGNRMRPRVKTLLDSLWKPTATHNYTYDTLGRPEGATIIQRNGLPEVIIETKEYGQFGLTAVNAEFEGMRHRMKVRYENGWPKRLVLWSETLDGHIQVLARLFIRFQSN